MYNFKSIQDLISHLSDCQAMAKADCVRLGNLQKENKKYIGGKSRLLADIITATVISNTYAQVILMIEGLDLSEEPLPRETEFLDLLH